MTGGLHCGTSGSLEICGANTVTPPMTGGLDCGLGYVDATVGLQSESSRR
jgi:hypothetical protein